MNLDDERAAARARHPSRRWHPPVDVLRSRLVETLAGRGVPHADVAVALLERRARGGGDRHTHARALGVPVEMLDAAEAGQWSIDELPGPIRAQLTDVGDDSPSR